MKGIVFRSFFDMVEENFGFETVDKLLNSTQLESDGAYTTVGNYDHHELVALVKTYIA